MPDEMPVKVIVGCLTALAVVSAVVLLLVVLLEVGEMSVIVYAP